jgi:hypothetical protein
LRHASSRGRAEAPVARDFAAAFRGTALFFAEGFRFAGRLRGAGFLDAARFFFAFATDWTSLSEYYVSE